MLAERLPLNQKLIFNGEFLYDRVSKSLTQESILRSDMFHALFREVSLACASMDVTVKKP